MNDPQKEFEIDNAISSYNCGKMNIEELEREIYNIINK